MVQSSRKAGCNHATGLKQKILSLFGQKSGKTEMFAQNGSALTNLHFLTKSSWLENSSSALPKNKIQGKSLTLIMM